MKLAYLTSALVVSALYLPSPAKAAQDSPNLIEPCPIEALSGTRMALPPDCGGPPPPPPPPPVPAKPKVIWYTPFSESNQVKVNWQGSSYATYYQLKRVLNGSATTVYSGSQLYWTGAVPSEGDYSFTVSACNSSGCSSTATQSPAKVSYGPRVPSNGLLAQGDLFSTQGFVPQIGMGYDRLRQELVGTTCLNTSNAQTQTLNNRSKTFNLSLSKSREELFQSLNLDSNLSVSASYSSYSGSYTGKKSLASTSKRVEETHILTASLIDRFTTTQLSNGPTLAFDTTYQGFLVQGLSAHFRNSCGDAYVASFDTGREATLTFQMTSDDYSSSEIKTKTSDLKIAIGSYVSAGYSQTKRTEINDSYSKYSVQVYLYSAGSASDVATVISLDEALDYLRRFEQDPPGTLVPYNYTSIDYIRPTSVPVNLWPDYKPKQNLLKRWYRFDTQVSYRCHAFELPSTSGPEVDKFWLMNSYVTSVAGSTAEPHKVCHDTKRTLQENIQNCEDTGKWNACIAPDSPSCPVSGSSLSCLNYAKQLPVWVENDAELSLDRELGSGLFKKCETESATVCLARSSVSIVDLRPSFVDCFGQGGCPAERNAVTVSTTQLHRVGSPSNSVNTGSKCLAASAEICRPGTWQSGAHLHQKQKLHGLEMLSSREYSF